MSASARSPRPVRLGGRGRSSGRARTPSGSPFAISQPSAGASSPPLPRYAVVLEEAGLSEAQWQERWGAERLFLTADGERDQLWGNLTIRWHPDEHRVEITLPEALAHLANRHHDRYRLSCQVAFSHRGEEVAAQATTGAVRYDITFAPEKGRWYLDASWKCPVQELLTLDQLRWHRVLSVDVNAGHLDAMVLDLSRNPAGRSRSCSHSPAWPPAPVTVTSGRQSLPSHLR